MKIRCQPAGNADKLMKIHPETHRWLQIFTMDSGLSYGEAVNLMSTAVNVRLERARAQGLIYLDSGEISDAEAYTLVTLYDAGLLPFDELAAAQWNLRTHGNLDEFPERLHGYNDRAELWRQSELPFTELDEDTTEEPVTGVTDSAVPINKG